MVDLPNFNSNIPDEEKYRYELYITNGSSAVLHLDYIYIETDRIQ